MRKYFFVITALAIMFGSCSIAQNNKTVDALEFSRMIHEQNHAQIVDVRTPDEYAKGHLEGAVNINWNGKDFVAGLSKLDKSQPVFVYCLVGGRSAEAAKKMRAEGFNEVIELNGGMLKWRAANLPEVTESTAFATGMSMEDFQKLISSEKLVLVDFYADWCAPCHKMKPILEEISREKSEYVQVVRINVDENKQLCKELNVIALPVLHLYKKNTVIWNHTGFIGKDDIAAELEQGR